MPPHAAVTPLDRFDEGEYEPLELSRYVSLTPVAGRPPRDGRWRGVPFAVAAGGDEGVAALVVEPAGGAPTVAVQRPARELVFAHRLLDGSERPAPAGTVCATYEVALADDAVHRLPIRERLEIGAVPCPWGEWALLAWPDAEDELMSRTTGRWQDSGMRLTGLVDRDDVPEWFYLWAWRNPSPDVPVAHVRIVPGATAVAVAAITLGHLDEPAFARAARRAMIVRPPDGVRLDARAANLEIAIVRGQADHPHPILGGEPAPAAGWGLTQPEHPDAAYAYVSAQPSAHVRLAVDGHELGSFRWRELLACDRLELPSGTSVAAAAAGRSWVRVEVRSAETGEPLACRVRFTCGAGIPHAPHGHHVHLNDDLVAFAVDLGGDIRLGAATYAYVDGACEGWLPHGEVVVEITRGFDHVPLVHRVTVDAHTERLAFELRRVRGWDHAAHVTLDTHTHFLAPTGAAYDGAGEGLDGVQLLTGQWGELFTNIEDEAVFGELVRAGRGAVVVVGQENRQHALGHLTLMGIQTPIYPLSSGGPEESQLGDNLEATLSAWADRCHAQGGAVILPHAPNPNGEPACLVVTDRIDAVEWCEPTATGHAEYYRYLELGHRLPLVAGTDKMSNAVPVGLMRTYFRQPSAGVDDVAAWVALVRSGRSFVSSGPLLALDVDGSGPGDTRVVAAGDEVTVQATAVSVLPFGSLELVANGVVVARRSKPLGDGRLELRARLQIDEDTWIAARCGGPSYFDFVHHLDEWTRPVMAHTSPVYLQTAARWSRFDRGAAEYLLTLVEGALEFTRQRAAAWSGAAVRHHHGEASHRAYLERPFLEAAATLRRRLAG